MKEKYVNFFKKELVILLILLFVICFSFGSTYSSFVYNSDSYRAVEMFTPALEYKLSQKEFNVEPGNNLYKINVESLNNIESYYKLIYNNKNVDIKYFNNDSRILKSKEQKSINLLIFNKGLKSEVVNLDIIGGFTTNTYDDIKVSNNYYSVDENIEIGQNVIIDNETYKFLGVNSDGSYELLGDSQSDILNIEGSRGYNEYIETINYDTSEVGGIKTKAISILDIEKYTKERIIEYGSPYTYKDAYYPALWALEEDAVINNIKQEEYYNRSEGVTNGNYEIEESITIRDIKKIRLNFINDKYKELFLDSDYLIATRYQKTNDNRPEWGVVSISDGNIKLNKLFESNNTDYKVEGNRRVIKTIPRIIYLFK